MSKELTEERRAKLIAKLGNNYGDNENVSQTANVKNHIKFDDELVSSPKTKSCLINSKQKKRIKKDNRIHIKLGRSLN